MIDKNTPAIGEKWYAYIEENPNSSWYNNRTYVDVMNKKAIDSFIECTYEKYFRLAGTHFGGDIPYFFTDEPHMTFKTNLDNPFSETDQFMPWTEAISDKVKNEYHLSIIDKLPLLFWQGADHEETKIRFYFNCTLSELFDESYVRNIGTWCINHNIGFTGHFLFEESLFLQNRSDGDLMRMYSHMDAPGMDLLFDDIAFTTVKQVQSIMHQCGKKMAMSEEYGGTNWNEEFRDYLFQGNWQAALGITLRVPHLSDMTIAGEGKRDFPASIFYQAPWFKEWKIIEDHFARVNCVMTRGKCVERIGVIHPLESYWIRFGPETQTGNARKKMDVRFNDLCKWLLYADLDFDYLDESMMNEIYSGDRTFGKMRYDLLVLPSIDEIRKSTISILERFKYDGGNVVFLNKFPKYIDGCIALNGRNVFSKFDKIPFTKVKILESLDPYRVIKITDKNGKRVEKYIYQLREDKDCAYLFICDAIKESRDRNDINKISIRIAGSWIAYLFDTNNGSINFLPTRKDANATEINYKMPTGGSVLFKLKSSGDVEDFHLHKWKDSMVSKDQLNVNEGTKNHKIKRSISIEDTVNFEIEEQNVLILDMPEYCLDDGQWQKKEEILRIDELLRTKLGFHKRNGYMIQPYRLKNDKILHRLKLRYLITSTAEIKHVDLALENLKNTDITWNGKKIVNKNTEWYIDKKIEKIKLGDLKRNENILELSIAYNDKTPLEACYLLGCFGIYMNKDTPVVSELHDKLQWMDLRNQGLEFYGGNIKYLVKCKTKAGNLRIEITKYRGALVKVFVDGQHCGNIIGSPYFCEKKAVEEGIHTIEFILFGNRYNTLSHLHTLHNDSISRSSLWRVKGNDWTYGYNTLPLGILEPPRITII